MNNYLNKVHTWNDFKNLLESKTKQEKGKAFEELTKFYLGYNPVYKSKLKNVWLLKEVPKSILLKIGLPNQDMGIDLIAETFEESYWAIQCKYLQDEEKKLSHRTISTFISLSKGIAKNISYCLVCTTLDDYSKVYQGNKNIGFCTSVEWRKLDKYFFQWLRNKISGKTKELIPFKPKSHQETAIKEFKKHFIKDENSRGKLVFPCGAGKSLTGYWIARAMNSKRTIVAVPSLSLVKQTLEVYLRETVANKETISWLCVCSDEGIGKNDDVAFHTNEMGVPCVTDVNEIADCLRKNKNNKTIIFTTYQSGKAIADASKKAKYSYDLGIMDEAHKTVGDKQKLFSHLLFDQNIEIKKRVFMTATERRFAGASDTVLSMDDMDVYGETFSQLSFKKSIESGILSDYKIITLFISNEEVKNLIHENAFVKPAGKEWDQETEARTLASLIALRKAMNQYPIHHAVTFHSSIKKAEAFEKSQELFSRSFPKFGEVQSYHVSGAMPTSVRGKIVDEFAASKKGIITNAKCLTEGVDVPNIDCVLFVDPRKSTVDIVQAVGRALRKKEGKEYGYVILPVFTSSKTTEEIIESDEFKEILSTIRALAANDERIVEYFKEISKGKTNSKKDAIINFEIDEKIAVHLNEKQLIDSLELRTWNKLAKLSWMPFEEARDFVRSLSLKSMSNWRDFVKSDSKPPDLTTVPDRVYKNSGWVNWGDWLGTFTVAPQFKEFVNYDEASRFARNNNINSISSWNKFKKAGLKPDNIPGAPNRIYKNEGWVNWGEFFGTNRVADQFKIYRQYNEARNFVLKLALKNANEWRQYCKSGNKPIDIPNTPHIVYKNDGWIDWAHFLGTSNKFKKNFLSFEDAKDLLKKLGIDSSKKYRDAYGKGLIKDKLPNSPHLIYKANWTTWGDFFGTSATSKKEFMSYNEAKKIVRLQKIKSNKEWREFCKSPLRPTNLPVAVERFYMREWNGWADFLGTKNFKKFNYLPFSEAKKFVQKLGLKTGKEWQSYCKSGKKPSNIPGKPERVYSKSGWVNIGDFLGTGNISNQKREYMKFEELKKYLKPLKLLSKKDWFNFIHSGKKPNNIPNYPDGVYKNKGWKGWADFFGK
ncbi:MAG: DEAD/DEAH box helicase family protein [Bacteroidota bacterium]